MKLNLFVTTDIHGHIFPTNYTSRENIENLGFARISSAIKDFKAKDDYILLDNGDALQGTPLLTYAHQNYKKYKNPMAQAFNLLNYDYVNLGNHDFNYGSHILKKYFEELDATVLTQNFTINDEAPGKTEIIEIDGKKVALIGLLTQYIPKWEQPHHIENMKFYSAYDFLKDEIDRIREDVDFIIAMYHGGMERNLETGEPTEALTGENEGYEMSTLDGLDLLITGHQHRSFTQVVNDTFVTQSTKNAEEFVTISIDLETREIDAEIHNSSDYEIDEELLEHFSDIQEDTQVWLDEIIGTLDRDLKVYDTDEARFNKHPIVSLINQIQMEKTGADLSSNAMFDGVSGFNQEITMRDIVNTYPYPNSLVLKEISGHKVKEMLELSARYYVIKGDEIAINPEYLWPKPQSYNYEMMDGLDYTIKVSNPVGSKIIDMKKDGKDFDLDHNYTLVVNNYRALGGGNFTMVSESPTIKEFPEEMGDIIYDYLKAHPVIKVNHHSNINIIK